MISNILLFCLLLFLPFGELARYQFNNGITITALYSVAVCILIFNLINFLKNKKYFNSLLTKPIVIFSSVLILSLLINLANLTLTQVFVSSLYILRWISIAGIYFFFKNLPQNQKIKIPIYLLISGLFFVIFGFAQYFLYPNLRNLYYAGWDEHYLRLFSTFFDPNFAGIFLVLYFLFILDKFFKSLSSKKRSLKTALGILTFLSCTAIFLTYSRSAFIALAAGLFTYLISKGKRKFILVSGIVSVLFFLFVVFLTSVPTEGAHLLRIPSSEARLQSLRHAFTIFIQNPVTGVGFNAYRYAQIKHGYLLQQTQEFTHTGAGTDNSFLFILATTGIVGFTAFLYLMFKMIKYSAEKKSEYSTLAYSSVIALAASSFFINSLFYTPLMLWMWMIIGIIENK